MLENVQIKIKINLCIPFWKPPIALTKISDLHWYLHTEPNAHVMKRIFLISAFLLSGYFSSDVMANHNDSVQVLKLKIETMEKQVQQLQAEIKTLRTTDSSLSAELNAVKKNTPAAQPRKLVIDRRGTKQAYLQ